MLGHFLLFTNSKILQTTSFDYTNRMGSKHANWCGEKLCKPVIPNCKPAQKFLESWLERKGGEHSFCGTHSKQLICFEAISSLNYTVFPLLQRIVDTSTYVSMW